MQDPREGVDRTTNEEVVKDGPSYTSSCLWIGFVKMMFAQKTRNRFHFPFGFFYPKGLVL